MKLFKKHFSSLTSHLSFQKGFTLIELLIVIAIIGVLAGGIIVVIDPIDKINSANDSRVQGDIASIGKASEAYAAAYNSFYPKTLNDLVSSGELKSVPAAPSGYSSYAVENISSGCEAGTSCTGIKITGQLKSKRFISAGTYLWRYESSTGKSCAITLGGACPSIAPTPTATPTE